MPLFNNFPLFSFKSRHNSSSPRVKDYRKPWNDSEDPLRSKSFLLSLEEFIFGSMWSIKHLAIRRIPNLVGYTQWHKFAQFGGGRQAVVWVFGWYEPPRDHGSSDNKGPGGKISAEQEALRRTYEKLGAIVDDDRGILKGSTNRALDSLSLSFWLLRQEQVPRKGLQVFLGREVHTFQFRTPLLGVFDCFWKDISDGEVLVRFGEKSDLVFVRMQSTSKSNRYKSQAAWSRDCLRYEWDWRGFNI